MQRVSFWLLTIVSGPFWLLASEEPSPYRPGDGVNMTDHVPA